MNIDEVTMMRERKDDLMRGYPLSDKSSGLDDRYTKDMFGGPHGIDPNSHGVELQ